MSLSPAQQREEIRCRILRMIDDNPGISQREMASHLGVSLGKVNYILRALKDKGLLKAGNFLSSDNKKAYLYLLTPRGIAEKVEISRRFLDRKKREYALLKAELKRLEEELNRDAVK